MGFEWGCADKWIAEELNTEAVEKLNKLERHQRYNDPVNWGFDVFDEHTPEELQEGIKRYIAKNKE